MMNPSGHLALSISTIRALCIDMVNKANSGHPGMALDAAPIMYALFHDHLVADPENPNWINRDRFVLSAGHVSALLYATLHLAGYHLSIDDLKNFRQLGSKTPGHPEFGHTPGVDATSGPLGQGICQAVGMAMAEKAIAAQYKDGHALMNHHTYCLCGDGCLEEGVAQEAISMAGNYKLNKLILIYDENGATLDGQTSDSLNENIKMRFASCSWDVLEVADGNDVEAISNAIGQAKESKERPTLIIVHTTIGFGSKKQGSHKAHGEPLGEEDGAFAKANYGYTLPPFEVAEEVYADFKESFAKRGQEAKAAYEKLLKEIQAKDPEEFELFDNAFKGNVKPYIPEMPAWGASDASRNSSGKVLSALAKKMPFAIGGSADVAGSTKTNIDGIAMFTAEHPEGRDVHFGIREFAMAGAANGMMLHGGLRAYVACFLIFSDYMKSAIRMSCLERLPVLYLFTHDSIAVGEDGPTHEPIEQLAALRSMPGLDTIRPADAKETYGAYLAALEYREGPTSLILSRQNLPLLEGSDPEKVKLGAYVVYAPSKAANATLLATGSEVSLAIEASKRLEEKGIYAEVVSMPSLKRFEEQGEEYKNEILHLPYERRVSLEMASTFGWKAYAKHNLGIDSFGASGKANEVIKSFGFDLDSIVAKLEKALLG